MPKVAKESYDLIDRAEEPEIYDLMDRLIAEHRDDLALARIRLAWRTGWTADADGVLTLGKCRRATELDAKLSGVDFVILLNAAAWPHLEDRQREALLFHELEHAQPRLDDDGEQVQDESGRPQWRIRKHDLEAFVSEYALYGAWREGIAAFVAAGREDAARPLLEAMRPKKGNNIESVTLSGGGKSVTLEAH
jgi:hypothetical protein